MIEGAEPEAVSLAAARQRADGQMLDADYLRARFAQEFQLVPRIFAAPGRVNLIGEHTDYNQGFVLPVAIDRNTFVAAAARPDNLVRVVAETYGESGAFKLEDLTPNAPHQWLRYVAGTAGALQTRGYALRGADLLIASDVPVGAGLSSSAALETAVGYALLSLAQADRAAVIDRVDLARAAQDVENRYIGIQSGIMDQLTSATARRGHALLIDCRTLATEYIPLNFTDLSFVVCDTRVKHDLAASEYNTRRAECERGVELLRVFLPGIESLRDVGVDEFSRYESELPDNVRRRCRHIIHENARTLAAAGNLRAGDFDAFGRAMYQSHASLRDDFAVSCAELDVLVKIAASVDGAFGARMTGGGFGGCTVNLVRREALENFQTTLRREYPRATGQTPALYVIKASDGVHEI